MITGKELVARGYKPGVQFRHAIELSKTLEGEALWTEVDKLFVDNRTPWMMLEKGVESNVIYAGDGENLAAVMEHVRHIARVPTVEELYVMPDACIAGGLGSAPVGTVVVTNGTIHPAWHSSDLHCSVMATAVMADPKEVLDTAWRCTHFGPGGPNRFKYLPYSKVEGNPFLRTFPSYMDKFLGSQGDGNHFLFVGRTDDNLTWIVTHHGSRKPGAEIYKLGMRAAVQHHRQRNTNVPENMAWLDVESEAGQHYLAALDEAKVWTVANHSKIHATILNQLDLEIVDSAMSFHNTVLVNGNQVSHLKGATKMTSRVGVIPLNMRDGVLLVDKAKSDYGPHGAGRNVSRTNFVRGVENSEQFLQEQTAGLDVRFWSGEPDLSELPDAYKPAREIIDISEASGLFKVRKVIRPYGCIMAGKYVRRGR